MLRNYLTVAFRNLRRQKGYAALNVAGLGVGLACCALIGLFVREELSYDRWQQHADRVYRITSDWGDFKIPATNWLLNEALRSEYPEMEMALLNQSGGTVRNGDRFFREPNVLFANPAVFPVLSFALARGDEATALAEPYQVVLSPAAAEKYFGAADPVGQTLNIYGDFDATVAGVLAPNPEPSHVTADFLISWPTLDAQYQWSADQSWGNNGNYTYLLLPDGMTPEALTDAFPRVIEQHAGEDWNGATLGLQALPSIHLTSHLDAELEPNGQQAYVVLFSAVALFILLLACVNFMNLATARSLERAREVGVRKSIGAVRGQLAGQFLAEAVLLAFFGLFVAIALVAAALPLFRVLADRPLLLTADVLLPALLVAVVLTVFVGLVAGSYPALVLSGFHPSEVLRGRFGATGKGARLRQGLVVFQFSIAVVLIVGTLGVYTQLRYLRTAEPRFDQAQVVSLPLPGDSAQAAQALLDLLRDRPEVESATLSSETFPSELLDGFGLAMPGVTEEADFVPTRIVSVAPDFFDVLGVQLAAGRDFRPGTTADSNGVILNETAARRIVAASNGRYTTPEALVGEPLSAGQAFPVTVLAIAPDFNMATLREAVEPVAFISRPDWFGSVLVRTRPGQATAAIGALRTAYADVYPDALFEYEFTDASFDAAYRSEERLGRLFTVFAVLAVFIACLGLFGLAAYAAQRRRKEIGVRKVLGASVGSIVTLLSRDFARLVLVAVVIAVPVAWFAMRRWLEGFAYHAPLGAGLFLTAGALALLVAVATVAGQALRAAATDPARALRAE